MSIKEQLKAQIDGFRNTSLGQMTVKELLTTTSNVALPTMVDARALLELQNYVDPRVFCKRVTLPKGAGKVAYVQVLTAPAPDDWSTEGNAISAADPTVANASITVAHFGKGTVVSDLLANTSAIDFVEEVGRVHGGVIGKALNAKVATALVGATGNAQTVGTKGDTTEANFDFTKVASAIGAILADGWMPDVMYTAPDKLWSAFTTSYAVTQFTGALADFMLSGQVPNVMGLKWYMDPYFELGSNGGSAWTGADGEEYAVVTTSGAGAGWAELEPNPKSEIYREPLKLVNTIVTSLAGASAKLVDNASAVIEHAA